jgi:beta-glucosidase
MAEAMRMRQFLMATAAFLALAAAAEASAGSDARPWMNTRLTPDQRADLLLDAMSLDEEISLVHGRIPGLSGPLPPGVTPSAGYIPGIPRLGLPAVRESDASLGVANAGRRDDDATPLPSGLSLAATWNTDLAFQTGAMIGKEARQKGFGVLLAGGVNLVRDPRDGRDFEYLGEDPLLAGILDGASIRGIQSQHIVSTAKHFVLNDQETGRMSVNAVIDEAALRESDLLAFEIAIEQGAPGSIMCAYNRVDGAYACENAPLLTGVLRTDWGWPGWVMSDWGAVHSLDGAMAGLDQQSGEQLDRKVFFDGPLKAAIKSGTVPVARLREMAHRYLRALFAAGVIDQPVAPGGLDTAVDSQVAERAEEQGIVLLSNRGGLLPLAAGARKIAVIGAHADVGVLSGGGSSQVIPLGSIHFPAPKGAPPWGQGMIYHPSSPLKAIKSRAGAAEVSYADGRDQDAAVALARGADVAVVFASQWTSEGVDAASLSLPDGQDALIEAVAASNPRTIVVLETGGPVLLPWLDKVGAVLEAWYPGAGGGEAIAKVLYGEVNPSGRLPVTFPASEAQLPRPTVPGAGLIPPESLPAAAAYPKGFDLPYIEGSDVGYRWFARTGARPTFPFGHGLTYSQFRYSRPRVSGGQSLTVGVTVTNTSARAGTDTPQIYLSGSPGRVQQRLIGWFRVTLAPGESRHVNLTADRRLLANWDKGLHRWRLAAGDYALFVGPDAETPALKATARLAGGTIKP